jgi:hypothetical protein
MQQSAPDIFEAEIKKEGNFTFVSIPFHPDEAWGTRPRYHVSGTVDGHAVRGCLGVAEGQYFLRLGAAWLRDTGVIHGAVVQVQLCLEGPHEGNLAEDISGPLSTNEVAKSFFDSLPTFYRKNFIRWIESAKRPETRAKRIAEMMRLLSEGKRERD